MQDVKDVCHSIKLKFCRGKLLDPKEEYKARAFWCAQTKDGYRATDCNCKKESRYGNSPQR